jgi:hypothetical protein
MGWRFRRTIKLLPGVHVNLSKSGLSLSLGGPGATVNLNKDGHRTTVGVPGSGLSYQGGRTQWSQEGDPQDARAPAVVRYGWVLWLGLGAFLFMAGAERLATAFAIVGGVHFVLWAISGLFRRRSDKTSQPTQSGTSGDARGP